MTSQTKTELAPIHDFSRKLRQKSLVDYLKDYARFQAGKRGFLKEDFPFPDRAPVSINLDLTTACNYACDHCVDKDILNTSFKFEHEKLLTSLDFMAKKGLKSVIIIGGGEPTTYPKFEEIIYFLKKLNLSVAIVSNGSGNHRILKCAEVFTQGDWIRLSLDAGSDCVFQAMHLPKKKISLDEICQWIPQIKEKNPAISMGFSFVIVWKEAFINNCSIIENIDEIEMAAERARRYKFDYISFKPFLSRSAVNNAEVIQFEKEGLSFEDAIGKIRKAVDKAKELETEYFKIWESTNLRVLENGTYRNYSNQPENCHMQFFRQVLSPLGLFNCPVYRHQSQARQGDKNAYENESAFEKTKATVENLIDSFNANRECREVTCLYNPVNYFIEDLIQHPEKIENIATSADNGDYYL
jgi:wyosine [tRNA(Phe)-imidazoG37] synthetase (radical SAM superfamily)